MNRPIEAPMVPAQPFRDRPRPVRSPGCRRTGERGDARVRGGGGRHGRGRGCLAHRRSRATPPPTCSSGCACVVAVAAGAIVLLSPMAPTTRAWLVAVLVGLFLCAGSALVLSGSEFPPLGVALDQGFRTAIDHEVRAHMVTRRLRVPGPARLLSAALLLGARTSVGLVRHRVLRGAEGRSARNRARRPGVRARALVARSPAIPRLRSPSSSRASRSRTGTSRTHGWPWWCSSPGGSDSCSGSARPTRAMRRRRGRGGRWWPAWSSAPRSCAPTTTRSSSVPYSSSCSSRSGGPRRGGASSSLRAICDGRAIVLAGAAVVSAVYWLPLLASIATTSGARSMQNRYYDPTYSRRCRSPSWSSTSSDGSCCSASCTSR